MITKMIFHMFHVKKMKIIIKLHIKLQKSRSGTKKKNQSFKL